MKKAVFEFIKKADFVLVFVLAVFGIVGITVIFITDVLPFNRSRSNFEQVAVAEDEHVELKEYLEFETKIKDAYVFRIRSSALRTDTAFFEAKEERNSGGLVKASGNAPDGITNFIFVKDGGRTEHRLFQSNVFIYRYRIAESENTQYPQECNVYAVVKNDTTNDKVLNDDDNIALYVSDYDGTDVKEISSSIVTFRFLDGEEFLFSEYDGEVQSYFVYDCKTNIKTPIRSVKQEFEKKNIALF